MFEWHAVLQHYGIRVHKYFFPGLYEASISWTRIGTMFACRMCNTHGPLRHTANRNFEREADGAVNEACGGAKRNAGLPSGTRTRTPSSQKVRFTASSRSSKTTARLSCDICKIEHNMAILSHALSHCDSHCAALPARTVKCRRGDSTIGKAPLCSEHRPGSFVPALPLRFEFHLRLI